MFQKLLYQITLVLCIVGFSSCAILKPVAKIGGAIVKTTGEVIQAVVP